MASMTEILPRRELADEYALRVWATEASILGSVTRTQCTAIIEAFMPLLPVHLSLSCRTPKGVLYVNSFDPQTARVVTYYLNHRARWIRNTPPPPLTRKGHEHDADDA